MALRRGSPGEPGEPGEPGTHGGGRGGTGGRGGRGGRTVGAGHTRLFVGLILLMLIFATATYINQTHIDANAQKIAALERSDAKDLRAAIAAQATATSSTGSVARGLARDLALIRRTDYRICSRQIINEAIINLLSGDRPRIPLLDCRPDLTGGIARPLSPAQTAALERRVAAMRSVP